MMKKGELYELGRLPFTNLSSLQKTFDNLPPDPYADDRLRSRRYSCFQFKGGKLIRGQHKDFMQSSDINKYVGDVERKYEEIEDILLENDIFLQIFSEFQNRTGLSEDSVIEAHQIRWHCKRRIKEPAPEGMHQDGFDFIGMYMINTYNVDGGEIMLYDDPDEPPCFKKRFENGEFAVMSDKKMFHNAAPLVPTANKEDGHWDMIVLTANDAA